MGENSNKTLILGVGNLLMSDEGVGVHAIQRFAEKYALPEGVQILDGGTLGLDLLYYLEGTKNLLLIDAVDAGKDPGTIIQMEGEDVPAFLSVKMSPHQIGIPDMLFAAKLIDLFPKQLVLFGVQPASLEISTELSPLIEPLVDVLVEHIVVQLGEWGYPPTLRQN
jgi:hydrogenase maturation protease